jgi:hypothetical protein
VDEPGAYRPTTVRVGKSSRPTESSDCYALGMVVYETISGNLPFHEDTDLTVFVKVLEGERPLRGAGFRKRSVEDVGTVLEVSTVRPSDHRGCSPLFGDVLKFVRATFS